MAEFWKPPFCLHAAGRGSARDRSYHHEVSRTLGPQRLLLKHTLSGSGVLYAFGKRFELHPGDLFIISRPGPYVYCFKDSPAPWHFEFVSMEITRASYVLPPFWRKYPIISIAEHETLRQQLQDLIDLRMSENYQLELYHSALAYQLFLSAIALRADLGMDIPPGVKKLKELIAANFFRKISIQELATQAGYTQEAITRLFQEHYKISPGQYLLNLRVSKACRLLAENNLHIQEIALACGFSNQNYFSRLFRKKMNVTPSQYRINPDVFGIKQNLLI